MFVDGTINCLKTPNISTIGIANIITSDRSSITTIISIKSIFLLRILYENIAPTINIKKIEYGLNLLVLIK